MLVIKHVSCCILQRIDHGNTISKQSRFCVSIPEFSPRFGFSILVLFKCSLLQEVARQLLVCLVLLKSPWLCVVFSEVGPAERRSGTTSVAVVLGCAGAFGILES